MGEAVRLLDLFCGEGGAATGYARAGFRVTGVDTSRSHLRRYPFLSYRDDAIEFLSRHGHEYDAVHASPPCQGYTLAQRIQANQHPDLIAPTRNALLAAGKPFVIENVDGAASELIDPILLCGSMFGLATYRHRLFETSWPAEAPYHPAHVAATTKMGRPPVAGEYMHIVGNFSGVDRGREIMGMPWASRDGLREAIPPAYTEHIGLQLMEYLNG